MGPLLWRPVSQTREPREWHCDCPAIRKIGNQRLTTDSYVLDKCFPQFRTRCTHAMTSPVNQSFPQPAFGYVQAPPVRSHDSFPSERAQAKTSPLPDPAPHERGEARLDRPSKRRTDMAPTEVPLATIPVYTPTGRSWIRTPVGNHSAYRRVSTGAWFRNARLAICAGGTRHRSFLSKWSTRELRLTSGYAHKLAICTDRGFNAGYAARYT
jgi:hypothetical protein